MSKMIRLRSHFEYTLVTDTMCLFNKSDLDLTSEISLNSFYWLLCDVEARPISYFFQFWSFGGAMGPQTGSIEPQIAQNRHSVP